METPGATASHQPGGAIPGGHTNGAAAAERPHREAVASASELFSESFKQDINRLGQSAGTPEEYVDLLHAEYALEKNLQMTRAFDLGFSRWVARDGTGSVNPAWARQHPDTLMTSLGIDIDGRGVESDLLVWFPPDIFPAVRVRREAWNQARVQLLLAEAERINGLGFTERQKLKAALENENWDAVPEVLSRKQLVFIDPYRFLVGVADGYQ